MSKVASLYMLLLVSTLGSAETNNIDHLMTLSLEELSMLNVRMETATKSNQRLADIPSSVYVLSNERILRSGALTIPDALALVPGLHVSSFSDSEWIVSSRGFHDGLFNKLLVLIDGRSVYSPLYGGVYWADIDYVLADIDRIEVLRGPGGALWGGNAVNGVINIITKSAKETKGSYIAGSWSEGGDYYAAIRHGLEFNESTDARAFYKQRQLRFDHSKSYPDWTLETAGIVAESERQQDSWSLRFGGERLKYTHDWWLLHFSDGYLAYVDEIDQQIDSYSFFTQFNYEAQLSEKHTGSYQLWVERNSNQMADDAGLTNTFDVDITHNYQINNDHLITYGGGFRLVEVEFFHSFDDIDFSYLPHFQRYASSPREVDSIVNIYAQSDKSWQNGFKTLIGLKAEYFEHTDALALSPQIRALYAINNQQTVWFGYGEASVAPSYLNTNTYLAVNLYDNNSDRVWTELHLPERGMRPESVSTFEVGYRYSGHSGFELDSTLFTSHHKYMRGKSEVELIGMPEQVYGLNITDDYTLDTYGLELSAGYTINNNLHLFASYSYFRAHGGWNGGDDSDHPLREKHLYVYSASFLVSF